MATALKATTIKNLKASSARREVPDAGCPGLFVVVQTSGHKSFAMRFRRPNGKPAKLTLGPVDLTGKEMAAEPIIGQPLTLAAARRLATDVQRQRKTGKDVVTDVINTKHRQQFEALRSADATFAPAARDFIIGHSKKHVRGWVEQARLLGFDPKDAELKPIKGGLADRWRNKPIMEIDGDDVYAVVDETRRKGAPGLARRGKGPTESRARAMHSALSVMFGWLVDHRRLKASPLAGIKRPKTPAARDRVLTEEEIKKFWQATDGLSQPFGQILKLLLLTGCRRDEIAEMERSELSADSALLTIPGSRTKNRREHLVPLAPLARETLRSLKRIEGKAAGYVFTTTGKTPVSGWSKTKDRLDAALKIPEWTIHDLRRTFATHAAELGIAPHIVEACINHISGHKAGVAGVYNRAKYLPEKKAALERWAVHVQGLVSGTQNIVRMRRGR